MDRSQIEEIRIEDYDYPLPDQRIARHPLAERDTCLLLVRDPQGGLSTTTTPVSSMRAFASAKAPTAQAHSSRYSVWNPTTLPTTP